MSSGIDQTDRSGVHAVGLIFSKELNWIFREQTVSDYGIDAHAEIKDDEGNPTGKLIALQIKSGKSYFIKKGDGYVYRGKIRHLKYWESHCLPSSSFSIIQRPA